MYVYLYVSPQNIFICINVFVFDPHMQDYSDMYHTVYTVLEYLFTFLIRKFEMWSSQFNFTRTFLNSV
jgi:hypothetical protein